MSLFERLILENHPHVSLSLQHRMRPQFSSIIRKVTYPHLKDDKSVLALPDIKGVSSNLMFINHNIDESSAGQIGEDSLSKVNIHESLMICNIVQYLLKQGYSCSDLVVLTPYLAQLKQIRKNLSRIVDTDVGDMDDEALQNENEDLLIADNGEDETVKIKKAAESVRVSTVDNYQGEESRIVIISLVRANDSGSIGFLCEPERVNVMLSRAKEGKH